MYNNKYMCLAIPGKVKEIQGERLTVEYPTETRAALAGEIPVKTGDYVLVQMGIVIKVVTKKEAYESWDAWKAVESRSSR
jgi:hydrogenase assembly chaperone HypC/HupF